VNREQLFKRATYALLDMQASTSQTFEQHFITFSRLLADKSLEDVNNKLVSGLDLERFLEASSRTQGGMVGSAKLLWPADADEVLGLQWLLVQKLAHEPNLILNFAHTFYSMSRKHTDVLHGLTRQLLIPFDRDYKEYVTTTLASSSEDVSYRVRASKVEQPQPNVIYHIYGGNARVNNHSVDYSVNTSTVSNTTVTEHLQGLRSEIDRAELTSEQKSEAIEVVDEIEAQIGSGKPKKLVLTGLLKSLPAIQSVTTIGKALYDVLHSSGYF
jgi:hypothetical protein